MPDIASSEDLELVLAISRTGSVGGAARRLQVTQPSASQRLARLERRAGLVLFERDTQGARPTPAGAELARQADHILGHLAGAMEAARTAGHHAVRRVGTISSLAERVLPALDTSIAEALVEVVVDQVVDHGDRLLEWLDEGTLDAAVLAIAGQTELPRSLRRHRIGADRLVLLRPRGVRAPRNRSRPLQGQTVVMATYDAGHDGVRRRLVGLGAEPLSAATVQVALGVARRRGCLAVLPASLATAGPGDRVTELPWRQRIILDLVTPRRSDPAIVSSIPALRAELALARS